MHQHHQTGLGKRRGKAASTGIKPGLFYGLIGLLLVTNALSVTSLLMHKDIARLLNGQAELVIDAYQYRIADLRAEVDRLHSRQYAKAGNFNLQMQELMQQQQELIEQHQYVRVLAGMAEDLGIITADAAGPDATLKLSSLSAPAQTDMPDLSAVQSGIDAMSNESWQALDSLAKTVESSTDKLVSGLQQIGVTPPQPTVTDGGIGGPFEPENSAMTEAMLERANALALEFDTFRLARETLRAAPVHKPLRGALRISSPFGPRKDPFLGSKGFHSGIDYPAKTGTPVLSAAAGKVVFAGRKSGYGNLIEVQHQNGLLTRYGHLSAINVKAGQSVSAGTVIGKVGSTGRSTGPHLHFEVRTEDGPVNPQTFINVGNRLSAFL